MEREKVIVLDVFLCDLHIIVTEDANESVDKRNLRGYAGSPEEDLMKDANGFVMNKRGSKFYVFLSPDASFSVIAHESVHLIGRVFNRCGIIADYDNDEAFAYYVGWIAGIIADEVSEAYKTFTREDDREG